MESSSHGQHQYSPTKGNLSQSNSFKSNKQNSTKNPQTDNQNLNSPANSKKVYSMTSFNESSLNFNSSLESTLDSSSRSDFPKSSINLPTKKSSFSNDFVNPYNTCRDKIYVSTSPFLTENEKTKQGSLGFENFLLLLK